MKYNGAQAAAVEGHNPLDGLQAVAEQIEFTLEDEARFGLLEQFADALADAKRTGEFRTDTYWESLLDADARSSFWWPTPAELQDWERRWRSTPVEQRASDPSLQTPWDFGSLIDAFRDGEYALLGCVRAADGRGTLSYEPRAFPFGGTGCMRALIVAFGGQVTNDSTE